MARFNNASISASAAGENTIVAAVTGKTIRVHRLVVVNAVATAQTITVKDAASGNTLAVLPLPSSIGGGYVLSDTGDAGPSWFTTATSGALIFSLSAATAINGFVQYYIV